MRTTMSLICKWITDAIHFLFMTAAVILTFLFIGMVVFWAGFLLYELGRNLLILVGVL